MIENVFIIGIDGAGRSVLTGTCPHIREFQKKAVTAVNAHTVMPSISAQCWGSMFESVLPEQHGYTNDNLIEHVHEMDDIYPTLFRIIKEAKPDWQIASFSAWNPINLGIVEQIEGVVKQSMKDDALADEAADYIRNTADPLAFFMHLDDLDHAGHTYDYFTPEYMATLPQIDKNVGKVLAAIDDAGKADNSLVVIVTDHGGGTIPKTHGTDGPKDMNIFMMVAGGNLGQNRTVTRDVSILDVAPIVLSQLGIPKPSHMLGNPDALRPGD